MIRRRSSRYARAYRKLRLGGMERPVFIVGAVLCLVGLFSGLHLLSMPESTVIPLLTVSGGLLLLITFSLLF